MYNAKRQHESKDLVLLPPYKQGASLASLGREAAAEKILAEGIESFLLFHSFVVFHQAILTGA